MYIQIFTYCKESRNPVNNNANNEDCCSEQCHQLEITERNKVVQLVCGNVKDPLDQPHGDHSTDDSVQYAFYQERSFDESAGGSHKLHGIDNESL